MMENSSNPPAPGWKVLSYPRSSRPDSLYHVYETPIMRYRFRSRKAAKEFIDLIDKEGGSEERAWERFKQIKESEGKVMQSFATGPAVEREASKKSGTGSNNVPVSSKRKSVAKIPAATKIPRKDNSPVVAAKEEETREELVVEGSPFTTLSPPVSTINGGVVDTIVMRNDSDGTADRQGRAFLDLWAGNRLLNVQYDLTGNISQFKPDKDFVLDGVNYSLISSKVQDSSSPSGRNHDERHAVLSYVATSGPPMRQLPAWDLQRELEKIGDFASLLPQQTMEALELFTTPAATNEYVWCLDKSNFELIDECTNVGCGFMPPKYFDALLDTAEQSGKDSLQVRIFGPALGVIKGKPAIVYEFDLISNVINNAKPGHLKGMLFQKKTGIAKIQVPPSMRKVNPSTVNNESWVVVIAKRTFPSQTNEYLGRQLDPNVANPPVGCLFPGMSEKYKRLILGLGVSKQAIKEYKKRAKDDPHLIKHSRLKGVCDPTGYVQSDYVFIPGFGEDSEGRRKIFGSLYPKIFVSSISCIEPSDAKILKVLQKKPPGMPKKAWDGLCAYQFGHIVFPTSTSTDNPSSVPLSFQVGQSDCDGDDFWCFWDNEIVKELEGLPLRTRKCLKPQTARGRTSGATANRKGAGSSMWLQVAQDAMLDLHRMKYFDDLVDQLKALCFKAAEESDDGIFDVDAISFGKAYKQAIDFIRHGGKVFLPIHLHDSLTEQVSGYLTAGDEMGAGMRTKTTGLCVGVVEQALDSAASAASSISTIDQIVEMDGWEKLESNQHEEVQIGRQFKVVSSEERENRLTSAVISPFAEYCGPVNEENMAAAAVTMVPRLTSAVVSPFAEYYGQVNEESVAAATMVQHPLNQFLQLPLLQDGYAGDLDPPDNQESQIWDV